MRTFARDRDASVGSIRTEPLWQEECPRPADFPAAAGVPEAVDVAIVGGGYTGLSAAIALAEVGASTAVLERHGIGWGASSRNGGMALCGFQRGMPRVFRRFGESLGRELWAASLEALALVENIHREEGLPFERTGELLLAAKPSHAAGLEAEAGWFQKNLGHGVRFLHREELEGEVGTDAFPCGLLDPSGGGVQPVRLLHALARRAARSGAVLVEEAGVDGLERDGGGFILRTARGAVRAREVLIASGGYTDRLAKGLKRRLVPVGSYIISTEPLPPEVGRRLSPTRRMMYDSKNFLSYFRLLGDGRLLWGGRNNLRTDLDLLQSASSLRRAMLKVFPYLEEFRITHSWTGNVDVSADRMPHLGRLGGVRYALGYGGHGVAMALYLGREAALRMSGAKARSPFEEIPHPSIPLYRDRPWFLPLLAAYYRLKDRLS